MGSFLCIQICFLWTAQHWIILSQLLAHFWIPQWKFLTLVLECLVTFLDAFLSILDATVFQQKECIVNWVNTWKSFHFNPLFVALSPNHISKFDYCMFVFLLWYCKMLFFALDVERSEKYYSTSLKMHFQIGS